jgi:hypothetical protein
MNDCIICELLETSSIHKEKDKSVCSENIFLFCYYYLTIFKFHEIFPSEIVWNCRNVVIYSCLREPRTLVRRAFSFLRIAESREWKSSVIIDDAFDETKIPFTVYHLFYTSNRFLLSRFDKECGEVRLEHCADRNTVTHPAEGEQT